MTEHVIAWHPNRDDAYRRDSMSAAEEAAVEAEVRDGYDPKTAPALIHAYGWKFTVVKED